MKEYTRDEIISVLLEHVMPAEKIFRLESGNISVSMGTGCTVASAQLIICFLVYLLNEPCGVSKHDYCVRERTHSCL
jgi:hypothetical protein